MTYKPQDLFLSVIDLFVILLPGGLLIFTLLRVLYNYPLCPLPQMYWGHLEASAGFALASYVLGHMISLVTSLAEDVFYNKFKKTRQESLELREKVAQALQVRYLDVKKHPEKVRRWAAIVVKAEDERAATLLERKDADRRFFRNIAFVFLVAATALLARGKSLEGGIWAVLFLLSVGRYFDQQSKFTRDVFEHFISLASFGKANSGAKGAVAGIREE